MITKPTVLVLGAGASAHINYPIGCTLREKIIKNLSTESTTEFQQIAREGFSEEQISNFVSKFRNCGVISIDAFLEHQIQYREIGRLAIAQALIPCENLDTLFPIDTITWYAHLFKEMSCTFEQFDQNQISFIIFNYDRSLEHFFFISLSNLYEKSSDEVAKKLAKLKFIHIYGYLDDLIWQNPKGRDYTKKCSPAQLRQAASKIRIIHDDVSNDEILKEAYNCLNKASLICFLGFGYDPVNMDRIRLNSLEPKARLIQGTCHDLLKAQRVKVNSYFSHGKYNIRLCEEGHEVLNFLRESVSFV